MIFPVSNGLNWEKLWAEAAYGEDMRENASAINWRTPRHSSDYRGFQNGF